MSGTNSRNAAREKRHERIRLHLAGTSERPRLAVFRSLNHIYAQVIDDTAGHTVAAASTLDAGVKGDGKASGGNIAAAQAVGRLIAERAKEKGVARVVFDRGGFKYHGRVAGLAAAAREGGLEF